MFLSKKSILAIIVVLLAYDYYKNNLKIIESPVIETKSGKLKGIVSKSREGRPYYEYLGIPYAKPPIGSLRFEPPEPWVEKWEGIRSAESYGSICLQVDTIAGEIQGEEDCLFLNVFTPNISNVKGSRQTNKLLPTMVWIHGGMFVYGSSNLYRPDYLMDQDIVLVTINYRLGSLGFLNTGDGIIRGNMALKDQNMALRWVQANVNQFGGDPNKVTIFGESAGAASVHHHVMSPLSKGLFHKAISQSGVSLNLWAIRNESATQVKRFSEIVGCTTENSKSMIDCLKSVKGTTFMKASFADLSNILRDPISVFNPTVELIADEKAFIIEHPYKTLLEGKFNKVPWITGINSHEGLLTSTPLIENSQLTTISENFNKHISNLIWHEPKSNTNNIIKEIKKYYFDNGEIDSIEKYDNWTNLFSDASFCSRVHTSIELQSKYSPVYAYYYSYKGEFSLNDVLLLPGNYNLVLEILIQSFTKFIQKRILGNELIHYGSCHFDEVALLFRLPRVSDIGVGHKDYNISREMINSWVSFASGKNSKSPKFKDIEWSLAVANPEIKNMALKYMHIDTKPGIIDEPNSERNAFWNSLDIW